ncbi:hypothetical protein PIB30_083226 [Stylosanthes scabra]|uniref:Uncharacterized protein n=1 Tax=Stylosanthes scabra TaxID=79078 RepID=A0ABU6YR52_9FABA|nr:hypothetical protein [Stylosanthes scabra]
MCASNLRSFFSIVAVDGHFGQLALPRVFSNFRWEPTEIKVVALPLKRKLAEARRAVQVGNHRDRIADINASRLDWNLVVGVVRMVELPIPSNPSAFYQGDRILCSIPKASFALYNKTLIQEFGIYNMQHFILGVYDPQG